jgi:hypothetical protein
MCTITKRSQPIEIPALTVGRQLGDNNYTEDHAGTGHSGNPDCRWRRIRPQIAEAMGMTLLPANAVLCQWCWTSLKNITKRNNHDQIRQRANTIVSQHVAQLPDQVVCSLAAVITHLLWLRGAAKRCVWTVARFRVRKDEQSVLQTDLDEAGARTGVGSFVTRGGAAGAMGGVMKSVLSWAVPRRKHEWCW